MTSRLTAHQPFSELTSDEKFEYLNMRLETLLGLIALIGRETRRPELIDPAPQTRGHLRVIR